MNQRPAFQSIPSMDKAGVSSMRTPAADEPILDTIKSQPDMKG